MVLRSINHILRLDELISLVTLADVVIEGDVVALLEVDGGQLVLAQTRGGRCVLGAARPTVGEGALLALGRATTGRGLFARARSGLLRRVVGLAQ